MEKVLTISIAAYNVEKYIRQTLESLIVEDIIDELEIFVVDDGGKDNTLNIAQEYAEKYPQSIFPIHKENGGYGSTVNYSIAHATGKYFKVLDGDDWVVRENMSAFVGKLKDADADVIINPHYKCEEGGSATRAGVKGNYEIDISLKICNTAITDVFGIWGITYKTEILKNCNLELPLHCLYTDQIFSTVPFSIAKTICFMNSEIYCYRIGRDGQSVSRESRIKHIDDNKNVAGILCRFYQEQEEKKNDNIQYLLHRISVYAKWIINTYLLSPVSWDVLQAIKEYDQKLQKESPRIYKRFGDVVVFKKSALYIRMLRITRYGKLSLAISKAILPEGGIKNWT
ncbi:MAG: glycosyltransferase [Bacteroides thetaiotaomicron]|nr:glycosyltransferase [Bacteroides thetaiotaomicron]